MRAKSLALITPNNSVHHFLLIEVMDQIEVLYLDDLKIKLRTFLVSPWKVSAKRYQNVNTAVFLEKRTIPS